MEQNEEYWKYRKRYDELEKEIRHLRREQREMRDLMEKNCNHSNLELITYSDFEIGIGIVEEEETQYKCKDCWKYFTPEEVKKLGLINKEVDVE